MLSVIRKTVRHGASYFFMQLASKVMGVVSFPIITRLLSIHDYGLLALANTTLLVLYAIGKCGIPRALITKIQEEKLELAQKNCWDGIITVSCTTLLVCLFYYTCLFIIQTFYSVPFFFFFLGPIVFFRNVFAVMQAWLRAKDKIVLHNFLGAGLEIGSTLIAIVALLMISNTVNMMFEVKMIFETVVVSLFLFLFFFSRYRLYRFDITSTKALLRFGAPLIWLELSMVMMTFGDRYQLGYLLDSEAIGLYSAAYNLAQYLQQLISQPLLLAIYPIYNRIFVESGKQQTERYLTLVLGCYFAIVVPIFIFVCYYSESILTILASEKYAQAALVVPFALAGSLVNGCVPIVTAGLYLTKKTKIIGRITVIAAMCNFILNWIFISYFGYVGAAISTFITFILLLVVMKKQADMWVRIQYEWRNIGKCFFFALIALLTTIFVPTYSIVQLLLVGALFVIVYLGLFLLFGRETLVKMSCLQQ